MKNDWNAGCVYPEVECFVDFSNRPEAHKVHLIMRSIVRKTGVDGKYYKTKLFREFLFKNDEDIVKNILGAANWFHIDMHTEYKLGVVNETLVDPLTGRFIYELDDDQTSEEEKLKELKKKLI